MKINETLDFMETLDAAAEYDVKIMFWEKETRALADIREQVKKEAAGSLFVMVGPEGGFTEDEVMQATESGFWIAKSGSPNPPRRNRHIGRRRPGPISFR